MTLRHPQLLKLLAPAVVFAALLAVLTLVNRWRVAPPRCPRPRPPATTRCPGPSAQRPTHSAATPTSSACERPAMPPCTRARNAPSTAALRRDPRNVTAVIGAGTLALARHDFREGLRLGERALALAPATVRPYAVIVDAQIELGRYDDAERSLAANGRPAPEPRLLRPRVLLPRADRRSARSGGGDVAGRLGWRRNPRERGVRAEPARRPRAEARTRRGRRGRLPCGARRGARTTVRPSAGSPGSRWRAGDLEAPPPRRCGRRRRSAGDPVALTEIELARGRGEAAAEQIAIAQRAASPGARSGRPPGPRNGGVRGRPREPEPRCANSAAASTPRRRASGRRTPSAGRSPARGGPTQGLRMAREALRLGSRDPSFHYHAGIAAAAAGRPGQARRELRAGPGA